METAPERKREGEIPEVTEGGERTVIEIITVIKTETNRMKPEKIRIIQNRKRTG